MGIRRQATVVRHQEELFCVATQIYSEFLYLQPVLSFAGWCGIRRGGKGLAGCFSSGFN
jgi:hypothetical protein